MRRLPILFVSLLALAVLVALPAFGQLEKANGTWIATQGLFANGVEIVAVDASPVVELLHMDLDAELREASTLFNEVKCGKVLALGAGPTMTVPFSASLGIGHWNLTATKISSSTYHMLYDCAGNAIGVAWVDRDADAEFGGPSTVDGKGITAMSPPGPSPYPGRSPVVAWTGWTTIRFYTLTGEPLALQFFSQALSNGSATVFELSGPVRAQRAFGEPTR